MGRQSSCRRKARSLITESDVIAMPVPSISPSRVSVHLEAPPREAGLYVAYFMTSARRGFWSHGLQHAANWSRELGVSLLVCETVRHLGTSSVEGHRFLLGGMRATEQRLSLAGVLYHPYVEPEAGVMNGLLGALARRASVLVLDDPAALTEDEEFPEDLRVEAVDGYGLLPLRADSRRTEVRRATRSDLDSVLRDFPARNPLAKFHEHHLQAVLPHITTRWPRASGMLLAGDPAELSKLGIEGGDDKHGVEGGSKAAFENWRELLVGLVPQGKTYGQGPGRIHVSDDGFDSETLIERRQRLGRHLSHGHISRHQIVAETLRHCGWTPNSVPSEPTDSSLWGLPTVMESLFDELIYETPIRDP